MQQLLRSQSSQHMRMGSIPVSQEMLALGVEKTAGISSTYVHLKNRWVPAFRMLTQYQDDKRIT